MFTTLSQVLILQESTHFHKNYTLSKLLNLRQSFFLILACLFSSAIAMQKSRASRFNLLFFHLSKKNKRISTAIAHATRDIVMLEIKIIQIIIPLIFAIGIIAIIYTFLKEPRIILGDLFSAIYFRIKEEFLDFYLFLLFHC